MLVGNTVSFILFRWLSRGEEEKSYMTDKVLKKGPCKREGLNYFVNRIQLLLYLLFRCAAKFIATCQNDFFLVLF
jgi:hypothetical protein